MRQGGETKKIERRWREVGFFIAAMRLEYRWRLKIRQLPAEIRRLKIIQNHVLKTCFIHKNLRFEFAILRLSDYAIIIKNMILIVNMKA